MNKRKLFMIFSLSLLILGTFAQEKEFKFSVSKAKEYWHYCVAAGCSAEKIPNWNLGTISDTYPGMSDIRIISNETTNAFAFLGYQPKDNVIYVVFRGTQFSSIKNWMQNTKFTKVPYEYCDCKVHEGFLNVYNTLKNGLMINLAEMKQIHKDAKISLLGHSLGGAVATLAAFDVWTKFGDFDSFMTFGSPRVGDHAFASWWNGIFTNIDTARVTHNRDPVPQLGPQSWDYQHVKTEVFFETDDGVSFKVCEKEGEDPNCSIQYSVALDVMDHVTYMGVFSMGVRSSCK